MRILATFLLLLTTAAPAAAKSYLAERFDARIRILTGGSIEVTETVTFRFEDGPFKEVFRDLPTRGTDGIDVVRAEMDGRTMPFGGDVGQVEVKGGSKVRVRWRFAPRSGTTHTFILTYVVKGVVQRTASGDRLDWVALPVEHAYRIETSEISIEAPVRPLGPPVIETRRVGEATVEPAGERAQILSRGIGKNGWIRARVDFPAGAVIAAAPGWQQRQATARGFAPRWAIAAGLVLAMGLILLIALRQAYDSPRGIDAHTSSTVTMPPDDLRPAIGGALAANGSTSGDHAMAALFGLADRGALSIVEEPRKWGQRQFTIRRRGVTMGMAPEEAALIGLVFSGKHGPEDAVSLSTAHPRIQHRLKEFDRPLKEQLRALGLLDPERMRIRSRYLVVSFVLLGLALVLTAGAAFFSRTYSGWPFLIPAAVALTAVLGFVFHGALTPLSNEGVRRAAAWRAYQRHLKEVARDRAQPQHGSPASLLPYAVALGLAAAWSKYVKHHPQHVPSWFQAMASGTDDGAFPAIIAAGGISHGGGSVGVGGAAGGGASGAS